jgi:hypothetical protein
MHPYAVDSGERRLIPFFIAVAGILAAWLFYEILRTLAIVIPWWFDAPAVMGFYGLFYTAFDRWLWRTPFMHNTHMVNIPDLNGKWTGYLTSSHDEHQIRHGINVTVYQTWSRIQIVLQSERSRSHSMMASIRTENPIGPELSYEYFNEPHVDAKMTMHIHRGTNRLALRADNGKTTLEGEYYTGRDRQNFGTMYLERLD